MQVIGNVVNVNQLDQRGDQAPLLSVSIEGFSVLMKEEHVDGIPRQGSMIKADVSTHWPAGGGRPRHWLQQWSRL